MPVWFITLVVIALASGVGVWLFRQTFVWTPLQQFYMSAYARSAVASSLGIRTGRYHVLLMANRRGSRLAIDDEVVPVELSTGETTFTLSALAREAASGRLAWRGLVYDHARFHAQLRVWIYADQTRTPLTALRFRWVRYCIVGLLPDAPSRDLRCCERPCLVDGGFPPSGPQEDLTTTCLTSSFCVHAEHTKGALRRLRRP